MSVLEVFIDSSALLEIAFKEAFRLPEIEQNAFAKWVLEELKSDRKWDSVFAESESALDWLADEAIEEDRKGNARPMSQERIVQYPE